MTGEIAVLVVEDEALIRMTIADAMRNIGLHVYEAANAQQALSILEQRGNMGLMFTDIDMLGHMNGIGLSLMVRDRWPPIRIFIASGKRRPSPDEIPAKAEFLDKPYDVEAVAANIRNILAAA